MLHFAHYNFVRVHKTRRVTPAVAAGVDSRLWSLQELVGATTNEWTALQWAVSTAPFRNALKKYKLAVGAQPQKVTGLGGESDSGALKRPISPPVVQDDAALI
ncbi:hypothetical protein SS37A_33520 [Methylocystis iwaonis]|uniref:Transposase n=1 Tax=Methylocystis iwaonis TaxID=2885079 RepID=A0ABM8ECT6_9HYPH|nr:hypothetical protein SS37A_33520 [Methylocystis iwaonis]